MSTFQKQGLVGFMDTGFMVPMTPNRETGLIPTKYWWILMRSPLHGGSIGMNPCSLTKSGTQKRTLKGMSRTMQALPPFVRLSTPPLPGEMIILPTIHGMKPSFMKPTSGDSRCDTLKSLRKYAEPTRDLRQSPSSSTLPAWASQPSNSSRFTTMSTITILYARV